MIMVYSLYLLVVPFCYIRIFLFRKSHVMPGHGKHHEEQVKKRRKRNHVTFTSNMIVWLVEVVSSLMVMFSNIYTTLC